MVMEEQTEYYKILEERRDKNILLPDITSLEHAGIVFLANRCFGSIYSKRILNCINILDTLKPGYDSFAITEGIKSLKDLRSGEFVLFAGNPGNGKTLAACILGIHYYWRREILAQRRTVRMYFNEYNESKSAFHLLEELDYLDQDRSGRYQSRLYPPEVKFIKSHDIIQEEFERDRNKTLAYKYDGLLIIDDIGSEHSSQAGFERSVMDKAVDHRYSNKLPTIITTNLNKEEFAKMYQGRILDRIAECAKIISVTDQSFRGKDNA